MGDILTETSVASVASHEVRQNAFGLGNVGGAADLNQTVNFFGPEITLVAIKSDTGFEDSAVCFRMKLRGVDV